MRWLRLVRSLLMWCLCAFGLPSAEMGRAPDGARSPAWYRTDVAVYRLRYENGWGKAELEGGNDGRITQFKIASRTASSRQEAA